MSNKPAIFSFFSGAGFLDLGFENSGFDIAFVNEYYRPFMETYIHSRRVMGIPEPEYGYHLRDITEFTNTEESANLTSLVEKARESNPFIGFIGGPPCPDFSVGGKNRGSEGENGKLSATYVEIICQQEPDFFLFENVKGLWRTKKHRAFYREIKSKLQNAGYVITERLINAIEYGVPQQRERIIMIGFKHHLLERMGVELGQGLSLSDVFPWEKHIKYSPDRIASIPWVGTTPFGQDIDLERPQGIPEELTIEHWFTKNDVYNHPNTNQYFTPRAGLVKFQSILEGDDSKKSYKRLHRWRYSPTAAYGNNEVHLHPYKPRRLSVAEALAIQSLPKAYTLPSEITLSAAFKTIGNGVPYLAAKGLAETIKDFLGVSLHETNSNST
ncbi:DNA cytosine methyltransferase [Paenibacillus amylolyticus]|uniref:DNA cytosine methyltransferase n=1 Tax=Paenibacillus amylolyticus TaxID=1451 RepID=UPI00096BDE1E|nr:DNA cytosine methyltransferase [Paenibacillus amylolyticus]OMF42997.1 modification methylase NmeDIP [Paenibacillus amylolyticus]